VGKNVLALALFAARSTFLFLSSEESKGGGGMREKMKKVFERKKLLNVQYCDTSLAWEVDTFFGWEGASKQTGLPKTETDKPTVLTDRGRRNTQL
jgi:hypothetical protein